MKKRTSTEFSSQAGWTMLEILIGLAIIGVILSILTPKFKQLGERSKYSRVAGDLRVLVSVFAADFSDHEDFAPDALPGQLPARVSNALDVWPQPPCQGWSYDWENVLDVNYNGFTRITVRNQDDKAIFYRCVNVYGGGQCDDPGDFIYGGQDINTLPTKLIACTET